MKKKIKKEVTLESVAASLDDLMVMVGNGFNHVGKQFEEVKSDIQQLQDGQDEIKLRLDHTAQRFELVELQKRVTHLEKKAGVHYR